MQDSEARLFAFGAKARYFSKEAIKVDLCLTWDLKARENFAWSKKVTHPTAP